MILRSKTIGQRLLAYTTRPYQARFVLLLHRHQRSNSSSSGPVSSRLLEWHQQGKIQSDDHQQRAAQELDRLCQDLQKNPPSPMVDANTVSSSSSSSWWKTPFASSSSTVSTTPTTIRGAYLYGGVGCGKTFVMKTFYDCIQSGSWAKDKQWMHYHKFMLHVHEQMHAARQQQKGDNLLTPVIQSIAQEGRLLCLDEFQVTDVADAMILRQLFHGLWNQGCVLVATSNRPPRDLYLHGLQRDRFLPFVDELESKCAIVNMLDSNRDYRMLLMQEDHTGASAQVYFFGPDQRKAFSSLYHRLTDKMAVAPTVLETQGRKVNIPLAALSGGIARFAFEDLCQKALGAADYLVIGQTFHTVFVEQVPPLGIDQLNWLRRFITFVDTMYDLHVTLILQTTAGITNLDNIFVVPQKDDYAQDEVFAFDRTRSRLQEMSSTPYLQSQWLGGRRQTSGDNKALEGQIIKSSLRIHPSLDDSKGQEEDATCDSHDTVR